MTMIKDFFNLKKEQLKYYINKENKVYMLIISYADENPVQLGVTDIRTPYTREEKLNSDIFIRRYEDGTCSYMTYKKGKYLYSYGKLFIKDERIVMLYRPSRKDKHPRDFVLFRLLLGMELFIKGRNKLLHNEPEIWKADRSVINEHICKNNIILREIEKLKDEYCFIGV